MGTSVDGVVAKRRDLSYQSGTRNGMQKIKKLRTADCVVGGFRYLEKEPLVGSLLLGLYNRLENSITWDSPRRSARKAGRPNTKTEEAGEAARFHWQGSWWAQSMEHETFVRVATTAARLVAEVQFDHFTGGRFRHGTKFLRWRPDKAPAQCTIKQVARENRSALDLL